MEETQVTPKVMIERPAVSVYIVTLNEAAHLAETLHSVRDFDEIIVVDSGSDDGTVDIAHRHGARVIHQQWLGYAQQKSFALQQCRNEWCLNLDGDEVLPPEMLDELLSLISSDACDAVRLRIEDIFMGAPMHPWSRKRSIVRCFKKSLVHYPTNRRVHENIVCSGKTVTTKSCLLHYGYDDVQTFSSKYMSYARLKAMDKFDRGKRASLLKLLLIFPLSFIKVYILRRMLLSGTRGLIQAYIEAMYALMKEAYLYQLERSHRSS
ncbi:MAG: glycosyltransferase family 2 protein [Halieaceae bacterium]|nr:glycosyltransferase family 2 protein [Halieaceae bacterium]